MMMNIGFFRDNGNSGYVLKPDYLRLMAKPSSSKRLSIHVISAHQLPKQKGKGDILDPYVELEIIGTEVDSKKVRTAHVEVSRFGFLDGC